MDKRKLKLLNFFLNSCNNGYKVIDNSKIFSAIKQYKSNFEFLKFDIEYLKTYRYIDLKYIDECNVCLSILDNSRIFEENLRLNKFSKKSYFVSLIINATISGLMAFIGAFLAIILTR